MDREIIEKAARLAAEESRPITDVRSTETYRRQCCESLVGRALKECLEKIRVKEAKQSDETENKT